VEAWVVRDYTASLDGPSMLYYRLWIICK